MNWNEAKIQILKSRIDILPKPVYLRKDIGQVIYVRAVSVGNVSFAEQCTQNHGCLSCVIFGTMQHHKSIVFCLVPTLIL